MQVSTCTVAGVVPAARSSGACRVETITDEYAFHCLEAEWNDAVARAGIAHPFVRHEWMRTWWATFGGGRRLHIIVVRSGSRIVAIAPLVWESAWMCGVPVRRLRLMQNDHTPRADFIVAEQPDRAYREIWSALGAVRDRWDVLLLAQLPGESPTRTSMMAFAREDGAPVGVWRSSVSPYLSRRSTWDAYFNSLPGKFRQNVRNRLSRMRRIAEPALDVVDGSVNLDAALADVLRLEESGWKGRQKTSIASDARVQRFYTQFAAMAAARGWLRLQFLTLNGQRIATSYSLCYGGTLFLCKTGYDPAYDTCSPFKVLTYFAARQAFEDGLDEVDFLGESEPWKLEWTDTARPHDWLFIFSSSSRARLVHPLKFRVAPALRGVTSAALPRSA